MSNEKRNQGIKLKSIKPVFEGENGVCIWILPDGSAFGDDDGRMLSLDGKIGNPIVEAKMRKAAAYWGGAEAALGRPQWVPNARRVSDSEREDQEGNFLDGKIPDPVDEAMQVIHRA